MREGDRGLQAPPSSQPSAFSIVGNSPYTGNLIVPIFWCSQGRRLHYIKVKHRGA